MSASSRRAKIVCVQGLGFVGAANAVAIASAKDDTGQLHYRVIGVEQQSPLGQSRATALNEGRFPFATSDLSLIEATHLANATGNLAATTDAAAFAEADIIVVDVGLDLRDKGARPRFEMAPFQAAISTVGDHMRPDALVLLESTVPPGTCERIVAPLLRQRLAARALSGDRLCLAYCYERVMPGDRYLASITEMERAYSGLTAEAAAAAEAFLATIVSPQCPLRRLASLRSAELAKIVENSFRAVSIAFIDEWERFGRRIGVDLFEVLEAVRVRPTHQNIRYPGLGVGGYCLSKDPLLGAYSAREIFGFDDLDFPLSIRGVAINDAMPLVSVSLLEEMSDGDLTRKRILVLGASYRPDIGDTRHSPSIALVAALRERGAVVDIVDPLAEDWPDALAPLHRAMPAACNYDIVCLAVAHRPFIEFDIAAWAGDQRPLVFDANGVLTRRVLEALKRSGFTVAGIGRGTI